MKPVRSLSAAIIAAIALATPLHAEGSIRIVQQFGTVFLPLDVIRDQHLIEKHGKALGLDITTEWHQLSGGAAVNDALLSGNIDIAGAGIGPFLTVWDRTLDTPSEVKIVGALGAQPNFLLTNKASIKTLKDFTNPTRLHFPPPVSPCNRGFCRSRPNSSWARAMPMTLTTLPSRFRIRRRPPG